MKLAFLLMPIGKKKPSFPLFPNFKGYCRNKFHFMARNFSQTCRTVLHFDVKIYILKQLEAELCSMKIISNRVRCNYCVHSS